MNQVFEFQSLINRIISEQNFRKQPERLYAPIEYVMSQGGKQLRPTLTLLACDLFDGNVNDSIFPALAVEIFHNFTLVHDDIMDKAPIRRGLDTVYKKWNSDIAILSGDTMFAMAYQYAVKTNPSHITSVLDVFSKTAIEVCEGQQLDMDFELRDDVTIDEYIRMITLKTAVLLGASLKIGGLIAGADEKAVNEIYQFGVNLGIAFQLQDDLLDAYGREETFGKKNGGDIVANKKTFLYLKAIEKANLQQQNKLIALFQSTSILAEDKISGVISVYDELNIQKETELAMADYYSKSFGHLSKAGGNHSKAEVLKQFAEGLYRRNK
ncbi:MAG TPA: polyprenyl synthetase family protein [Bacteroidales bacterium]|nr:polyprenyl synthetase family protein [Bacteroidales bacterium]